MKKTIGVILIIIGFGLAVMLKIGPAKETAWMYQFGEWPLIILAVVFLIPGLILYNKSR